MTVASEIRVWDPIVRIGHWLIVIGFTVNYIIAEPRLLHVWIGYSIGTILVLRIIWGLVGSRYARFRDFMCGPTTVLAYLRDLLLLRSRRYLGHSPAGGAMVVALLVLLGATVIAGLLTDAARNHAGPLAGFFVPAQSLDIPWTIPTDPVARAAWQAEWRPYRQFHSLFADLTLILIGFHIAGVLLASYAHHENLVRAMLTGRKRTAERET
jgi:cytochrome b